MGLPSKGDWCATYMTVSIPRAIGEVVGKLSL